MKQKTKFYAVIIGREPGVYGTLADANKQVHGFSGFQMRSFASQGDAEQYFKTHTPGRKSAKAQPRIPIAPSNTTAPQAATFSFFSPLPPPLPLSQLGATNPIVTTTTERTSINQSNSSDVLSVRNENLNHQKPPKNTRERTTFLDSPTASFQIEPAKSSRAKCKSCFALIPKDALRIGKEAVSSGIYDTIHWYHLECFKMNMGLTRFFQQLKGFSSLTDAQKSDARALLAMPPQKRRRPPTPEPRAAPAKRQKVDEIVIADDSAEDDVSAAEDEASASDDSRDSKAARCPANEGLVKALGGLKFRQTDMGGRGYAAYKKAQDAIRQLRHPVTSGAALARGKSKVAGIGPKIASMIDKFLTKGFMNKNYSCDLEDLSDHEPWDWGR